MGLESYGNTQGGDVVLRIVDPHTAHPGAVLGSLSIVRDVDLSVKIWYSLSEKGNWTFEFLFTSSLGNRTFLDQGPEFDAGTSRHYPATDHFILPGPASYQVIAVRTIAPTASQTRVFFDLQSDVGKTLVAPHGLLLLSAILFYVGTRALPVTPLEREIAFKTMLRKYADQWVVPMVELFGHSCLAFAAVSVVNHSVEGIPIEWIFVGGMLVGVLMFLGLPYHRIYAELRTR
jgi:hypothetical protein